MQLKRLANQINEDRIALLKVKLNEPVAVIHILLLIVQGFVYWLTISHRIQNKGLSADVAY